MIHERYAQKNNEKSHPGGALLAVHFKLHGDDGVSLQSQLLHAALRDTSVDIFECCADLPTNTKGLLLPELSYQTKDIKGLRQNIFDPASKASEEELLHTLDMYSGRIRDAIETYVDKNNIRVLDVHNIFSLPYNPAATLAFYELAKDRQDIQFIAHHHDFIFEDRSDIFFTPKYSHIADRLNEAIIPELPNVTHVTINSGAADFLRKEKNIEATVIPDGFNFDAFDHEARRSNTFREITGISPNDLVVGVMTRIVPRKAIEFAVQFVDALTKKRGELEDVPDGIGPKARKFTKNSNIVLVVPQHEDLTDNGHYFNSVKSYAANLGVRIVEAENLVESDIQTNGHTKEKIPFYDIYNELDIVCYPTTQEGFGNQLLESVALSRGTVPVVFEYPVFRSDIAPFIPHVISLGHTYGPNTDHLPLKSLPQNAIDTAVDETIYYLTHPDVAASHGQENFRMAKAKFNMPQLANQIINLIRRERGLRQTFSSSPH